MCNPVKSTHKEGGRQGLRGKRVKSTHKEGGRQGLRGKRVKSLTDLESYSTSASTDDKSREGTNKRTRRRTTSSINARINEELLACSQHNEIVLMLKSLNVKFDVQSKQLEKVLENQNVQSKELEKLRKQLELNTNGTSHASDAPRSQSNQLQPPRYRLVFTSGNIDTIEKGQTIDISVALVEGNNDQTVENGPLASATVELVVVKAEFNEHDNQHNWSREDFESYVKKPSRGNVDKSAKSIVSNGRFNLVGGAKCHRGSTIFENSSNKKVRLGVIVLSPTEERVLEGLSNSFFVRGHDRPGRQNNLCHNSPNRQRQPLVHNDRQEQNSLIPNRPQPSWINSTQTAGNRCDITGEQSQPASAETHMHSTVPSTGAFTSTYHNPDLTRVAGATSRQNGRDTTWEQSLPQYAETNMLSTEPMTGDFTSPYHNPNIQKIAEAISRLNGWDTTWKQSLPQYAQTNMRSTVPMTGDFTSPYHNPDLTRVAGSTSRQNDTCFNTNLTTFAVQLVWDRPNVEPSKRHWNLLDQLMPLPKFNNCCLPTTRFLEKHLDPLTIISKEVMQTRQNRGVIIELLEPDDSDEERQLKRKMRSKYKLRFVNKVCEAYRTKDPIKADDGSLLKVALFDENRKITYGPLSSASVQIVVLHGDFNDLGQDYWTSEEFSRYEVCPRPGEEASSVLGGNCILVLADGEACLGDAFFKMASYCARTGKFKLGIRLASAHEERIQEGVSEQFWVKDRHLAGECGRVTGIWPEDDTGRINHPLVVQAIKATYDENMRIRECQPHKSKMADIALGSVGKIVEIALKIKEAVETVKQNEEECRDIQRCVARVSALPKELDEMTETMKDEVMRDALEDLAESLKRAHELVTECQRKHIFRHFFEAGDMAKELRRVKDDIVRKLQLGNFATIQSAGGPPPPPSPYREVIIDGFTKFSLSELKAATENFLDGNMIGRGDFGEVYKGVLPDGQVVAIKKLDAGGITDSWLHHEIKVFVALKHKNISRPLGYCREVTMALVSHNGKYVVAESREIYFVEEYMENGSMEKIMNGSRLIGWSCRFKMIQGIAQGLHYLHEQRVVHMDLKPQNILFDSHMNPRISYFGVPENYSSISKKPLTMGYMAPDYLLPGLLSLSPKCDVYSFGVTLLRNIIGSMSMSTSRYSWDAFQWAFDARDNLRMELFKPSLCCKSQLMQIKKCMEIGLLCVEQDRKHRPTMADVLAMLNGVKELPALKRPRSIDRSIDRVEMGL